MRSALLAAALVLVACSSARPGTEGALSSHAQPLTVLRATLTGPTPSDPIGELRVAVIWNLQAQDAVFHAVAEDVSIGPMWPARLSLAVAPQPPPDAITKFDEYLNHATANVVVYEDRNGNGKLDLIPRGSDTPIDILRGVDDHMQLEWYDAADDDDWNNNEYTPTLGLARGMNLVWRNAVWVGPECVASPCGLDSNEQPHALPPNDEVVIATHVSPNGATFGCEQFVDIDSSAGGGDCAGPRPPRDGVVCDLWKGPDGGITVVAVPAVLPMCHFRGFLKECHIAAGTPNAPVPWPCPL